MSGNLETVRPPDSGLLALVTLLRFHGIGADTEQLRYQFGMTSVGIPEMIRCAKEPSSRRFPAPGRFTRRVRQLNPPLPPRSLPST